MSIGRNQDDNLRMQELASSQDIIFRLMDLPGPLGLARHLPGQSWSVDDLQSAAGLLVNFSSRARTAAVPILVEALTPEGSVSLTVDQKSVGCFGAWREPSWEDVEAQKKGH